MLLWWLLPATLVAAIAYSGGYLVLARRWHIYALPNVRNAHTRATPSGGGIAIFLALCSGVVAAGDWPPVYCYLLLVSLLLVLVGALDDRFNVPLPLRLTVYVIAALATVAALLAGAAWYWQLLALLYILWLLNLFNFMDGIDGIAASQAAFIAAAVGALSLWRDGSNATGLLCCLLAAACLGFLVLNRAPARLFMGDAGSVSIGFLLAALSLLGTTPLALWLILAAAFIVDASATLLWRLLTGQAVTEAHNTHLYQRLARHWRSHARVVLALSALNIIYLLPLAALAWHSPQWRYPAVIAAYTPLLLAWGLAVRQINYRDNQLQKM